MAFSSVELWQRIAAEGLASPMQCRSWASEVAKAVGASDTTNGTKILQALIGLGKLTKYQAKILAGQSDKPLYRGKWSILEELKQPLWADWLAVRQVDLTKAEPAAVSWVRWLTADALEGLKSSAPSLPRGLQLASVEHPHLQSVYVPELQASELQVQVGAANGQLLPELFGLQRPPQDMVTEIVRQIASALAALHAVDIVHGRVFPDRICLDAPSETAAVRAKLLCDPLSSLTASLDESSVGLLGEHLGSLKTPHFLAPEFIAPGQLPTLATDVYALGCTWWWLLTGEPVASGSSTQQILASHTQQALALPDGLGTPEPIARCLQHCLAKNLDARFADASQLTEALDAALTVVAKGKVPIAGRDTASVDTAKRSLAKSVAQPASKQSSKKASESVVASEAREASNTWAVEQVEQVKPSKPTHRAAPVGNSRGVKAKEPNQLTSEHAEDAKVKLSEQKKPKPSVTHGGVLVTDETEAQQTIPLVNSPAAVATSDRQATDSHATGGTASSTVQVHVAPALGTRRQSGRKKRGNKWLLPVAAGMGFLMLILIVLKLSGALEPSTPVAKPAAGGGYVAPRNTGQAIPTDPRVEDFQVVDDAEHLWLPPRTSSPLELDLLPPGGQMFVALRPSELMQGQRRNLMAALDQQIAPGLAFIRQQGGQPIEALKQVTVGFYSAEAPGAMPQVALRIELQNATPLQTLKSSWGNPEQAKLGEQEVLVSTSNLVYYIPQQPLINSQSVSVFSVGPAALMRDVAEGQGAEFPLTNQMERLRQRSDRQCDLSVLASPRYLFTEGSVLLSSAPPRLERELKFALGIDTRAALLQTQVEPNWYIELQLVGASDRDSPGLLSQIQAKVNGLPMAVEDWFVNESPHSYWRGLALRYPQMLRSFSQQTRFGIEDGIAVMNAYHVSEAAPSLLIASWIALQEGATLVAGHTTGGEPQATTAKSLSIDEYLSRGIKVTFDQEPIEVALALIGEEANNALPVGTPPLRFELDGDAFELAGITRNQQLRDFKIGNGSVRDALTEVARRGNPVTTVTDLREENQKLVWVVIDDPQANGERLILLTTRAAAAAASWPLPIEFASEK